MIERRGSAGAYVETLKQLSGFVERAATVIPGHGAPLDGERARQILEEDVNYLRGIIDGATTMHSSPILVRLRCTP